MTDLSKIQARTLMGPGPSDVPASALEAMGRMTLGPNNIAQGIPVEAFSHLVRWLP